MNDDFGLTDAIRKAERERDWMPIAILVAYAFFAWFSGYSGLSNLSAFEGFVVVALFASIRGIYQNKVTILRLEKRREFIARKEKEANWLLSQQPSVSHVAEVDA